MSSKDNSEERWWQSCWGTFSKTISWYNKLWFDYMTPYQQIKTFPVILSYLQKWVVWHGETEEKQKSIKGVEYKVTAFLLCIFGEAMSMERKFIDNENFFKLKFFLYQILNSIRSWSYSLLMHFHRKLITFTKITIKNIDCHFEKCWWEIYLSIFFCVEILYQFKGFVVVVLVNL